VPRSSPLRRSIAIMGLVLMIPLGLKLLYGELSLPEAGKRAAVTFLAVIVCVRIFTAVLGRAADVLERADAD
jgi:hypothetical protein